MLVIYLLTIFAAWSTPTVRASIGKIERAEYIAASRSDGLSHHLQGIVMTEFSIEQKVHNLEGIADLLEQPPDFSVVLFRSDFMLFSKRTT